MSVEEQSSDRTSLAVAQPDEVCKETKDDQSPGDLEESERTTEKELENEAQLKVEPSVSVEIESDVRRWFLGLSTNERVAAIGISDSDFLATLLEMSPWSPDGKAVSEPVVQLNVDDIEWEKMVNILELEAKLRSSAAGALLPRHWHAFPAIAEEDQSSKSENENDAASDVFRIRQTDEKSIQSLSVDQLLLVRSLLNNLCVIFPSATKFLMGKVNVDGKAIQPYITLKPTFFENMRDEELILTLDAMARHVFGEQFLFNNCSDELQNEGAENFYWFESLFQRKESSRMVPFFAMILTRFEMSVRESYKFRLRDTAHGGHGNGSNSGAFMSGNLQVKPMNAAHLHYGKGFFDLLKTKGNLLSASSSNQSSDGMLTLENFLATLVTTTASNNDINIDNKNPQPNLKMEPKLVLTPLSVILSCRSNSSVKLFDALNKAIDRSINTATNTHTHAHHNTHHKNAPNQTIASKTTIAKSKEENVSQKVTHVQNQPETSQPSGGGGKKKKKRNKRRKGKGQHNGNVDASVGVVSVVEAKENISTPITSPVSSTAEVNPAKQVPPTDTRAKIEPTKSSSSLVSHDSEDTYADGDATAARSEASVEGINHTTTPENKDIVGIKPEGVPTTSTAPTVDTQKSTVKGEEIPPVHGGSEEHHHEDDDHTWETVEVRTRANRKKATKGGGGGGGGGGKEQQQSHSAAQARGNGGESQNTPRKHKNSRSSAHRRRNHSRNVVKDIIHSILDRVEGEVHKRKKVAPKPATNPWQSATALQNKQQQPQQPKQQQQSTQQQQLPKQQLQQQQQQQQARPAVTKATAAKESTLRDVVLGRHNQANKAGNSVQVSKSGNSVQVSKTGNSVQVSKAGNSVQVSKTGNGVQVSKTGNGVQVSKSGNSVQVSKTGNSIKVASSTTQFNANPAPQRIPEKANPQTEKIDLSSAKNCAAKQVGLSPIGADQNTAPTYQETVSAVSAASNIVTTTRVSPPEDDKASKCDSSLGDTEEVPPNVERAVDTEDSKGPYPNPPLPTLLSAENANSANSSVASSLEVPHTSRRHHHSASPADATDVGYHLLDVCDRLSRDMNLFMSRRSLALSARRRERGALLGALQDTISNIWPGRGHAELYGSCATQLDLPSSDLDVVVIGIDQYGHNAQQMHAPRSNTLLEGVHKAHSMEDVSGEDGSQRSQNRQQHRHHSLSAYAPINIQINAERVVRLAMELEAQPWAVHINAIPTASVPVVKILADPLKLGAASSGDWMMHHQRLTAQVPVVAGHPPLPAHDTVGSTNQHVPQQQQFSPPWRGADIMNGLLSLDITFDGPEHGGIGSTHYSARVVAEACQEFGAPPDATPLVQVVMVLKELLVQRKLNEPYSGGLSSYALLLLVVALMRERAVIREEIERAERQRKAMSAGDGAASLVSPADNEVAENSDYDAAQIGASTGSDGSQKGAASGAEGTAGLSVAPTTKPPMPGKPKKVPEQTKRQTHASTKGEQSSKAKSSGSWASIASKASIVSSNNESSTNRAMVAQTSVKPASFADALARSAANGATAKPASSSRANSAPASIASDSSRQRTQVNSAVTQNSNSGGLETTQGDNNGKKPEAPAANAPESSLSVDPSLVATPSLYPQGYNDVIEVLCSGPTTAGKLLMHFLLYYGEHFEAQSTAIDISGKHERGYHELVSPYSYYSPYIQRRAPGTIDPVTGMLTVDPIVIYDPLEGAEHNNVARRCFAWSSVKWIFAQSYATLSNAVERSATPPATPNGKTPLGQECRGAESSSYALENIGDLMDPSSSLLRCLLSF